MFVTESPRVVVVASRKSVGLALLLSFLFGPLGMLYSTVAGALVMMVVGFLVGAATFGLGLIVVWPICIVWGMIAAASHNARAERLARS